MNWMRQLIDWISQRFWKILNLGKDSEVKSYALTDPQITDEIFTEFLACSMDTRLEWNWRSSWKRNHWIGKTSQIVFTNIWNHAYRKLLKLNRLMRFLNGQFSRISVPLNNDYSFSKTSCGGWVLISSTLPPATPIYCWKSGWPPVNDRLASIWIGPHKKTCLNFPFRIIFLRLFRT